MRHTDPVCARTEALYMLSRETTALIVIDVQGRLARIVDQSEAVIANIRRCIAGAEILELPVLLIEQNPQGLGSTVDEVKAMLPDQTALAKTTFSCCGNESITSAIAELGCQQLLVCGIEAHVCVYQSVADLLSQGYQVELVADAVSSRTAENRQQGIDKMRSLGAGLTSTEMCLLELTVDSASPQFKQLLSWIK